MKIEGLLISCQPSIAGFLERGNTPGIEWIGTVCPDPVIGWKKCIMFLIDTSGSKGVGIMNTSGVTERVVDNQKVVGHNHCLEFILIFDLKKKKNILT